MVLTSTPCKCSVINSNEFQLFDFALYIYFSISNFHSSRCHKSIVEVCLYVFLELCLYADVKIM